MNYISLSTDLEEFSIESRVESKSICYGWGYGDWGLYGGGYGYGFEFGEGLGYGLGFRADWFEDRYNEKK
jgi:hypothetical protein